MLCHFVDEWANVFHHLIPLAARKIAGDFRVLWRRRVDSLYATLQSEFPEQAEYLDQQAGTLATITDEIKDGIYNAVLAIEDASNEIHPQVVDELREAWKKAFGKALEVKGEFPHQSSPNELVILSKPRPANNPMYSRKERDQKTTSSPG